MENNMNIEERFQEEEWKACGCGKCGFVYHKEEGTPIVKVTVGAWGDNMPVIRRDEDDEPYVDNEFLEYGSVPQELAFQTIRAVEMLPQIIKLLDKKLNIPEWREIKDYINNGSFLSEGNGTSFEDESNYDNVLLDIHNGFAIDEKIQEGNALLSIMLLAKHIQYETVIDARVVPHKTTYNYTITELGKQYLKERGVIK
jgi:hypothetical protein